uniref:Uncharacterized protein n=1 Tax=Arion vulgaris TaxID=1028688 RepID=A0A0B7BRA7_9EUPU
MIVSYLLLIQHHRTLGRLTDAQISPQQILNVVNDDYYCGLLLKQTPHSAP